MKILFPLILSLLVSGSYAQTLISPASKLIRITGRVKHDGDSVTLYWSGTSVQVKFIGTSLNAQLKDERGENYFNVIIDHDSLHYFKLDTVKRFYTLAAGLTQGEHTIELVKRNEWDRGNTLFYGMEVNGVLLPQPSDHKKVIEFFGNSITAGYAIEDYSGKDSPDSIYTNNYYTYAALTSRHFNADMYCTVKSGIGILISWFPLIMPEMYDRLDPTDSLSKWNFKTVTPDIVVINLFQNDSWLIKQPEHSSFKQRFGSKPPDEQTIIAAYQSFVKKIRAVYPDAHIICALGAMDATQQGSPWPGFVSKAVARIGDQKIHKLFFPFTDKNGHPRKEENAKMAELLIAFIEDKIW